jgi:hypothetical protein
LQGQLQSRSIVIAGPISEQEHSFAFAGPVLDEKLVITWPVLEQEHSDCRTSSKAEAQ